jgi:SAM-dependent methyltransferase
LRFVRDHERPEEAWSESLAAAWEERRSRTFERHRRVSEWLVDAIAPREGHIVLELAAGPGETGFLAAERVGPTGKLISTDLAAGMVGAAARGAQDRGLPNVEARVMNAQHIELPDYSVDGVICRFGLMLMPEPQLAVSESHRVLRQGGHFAYAVFGRFEGNPWVTLLADSFGTCGHQLPDGIFDPGGSFFSLADPKVNRRLLSRGGFSAIRIEEIDEPRVYEDFDEYWDHHTHATGPFVALTASLSGDEVDTVREAVKTRLAPFQTSGGYRVPSLVVVVDAS